MEAKKVKMRPGSGQEEATWRPREGQEGAKKRPHGEKTNEDEAMRKP